jgi:hypothetical protein
MPSSSKKQHDMMMAVAHSPDFAKKVGIPQSVGQEFAKADKPKKFGMGGSPKITRGGAGMINKQETKRGSELGYQKSVPNINLNSYEGKKGGGMVKHDDLAEDKKLIKRAFKMHDSQEHKGSKGTDLANLKKGGSAMKKDKEDKAEMAFMKKNKAPKGMMAAERKEMAAEPMGMKKGGSASARADGIAQRGKTRGKLLACGGSAKKGK